MKIVIAEGPGALGRLLCADLTTRGHEVVLLSDNPQAAAYRTIHWDGVTVGSWATELAGSAVVNLSGEMIDRRPTPTNLELLIRSRVERTRALAAAAADLDDPVLLWLQSSTLALYGDAGERLITEGSPPASGSAPMSGVARACEAAAAGVHANRQVILRTSVVLHRDSPVLNRLTGLVRCGFGGRVGTGQQWFSWIHIRDWLRVVESCLHNTFLPGDAPDLISSSGAVTRMLLATSPQPVRNEKLMATLRQILHRPPAPPTPKWLVRSGALVLRADPTLALTGRRAVSTGLATAGFEFQYPRLRGALQEVLTPV